MAHLFSVKLKAYVPLYMRTREQTQPSSSDCESVRTTLLASQLHTDRRLPVFFPLVSPVTPRATSVHYPPNTRRSKNQTATQHLDPGHYDAAPGIDATSTSSIVLPLPQKPCSYDTYIRSGRGQTTGSDIGPGKYQRSEETAAAPTQASQGSTPPLYAMDR